MPACCAARKTAATRLSTRVFRAAWIGPDLIDSIGRGGRIRTADPLRPRRFPAFAKVPYFQHALFQ